MDKPVPLQNLNPYISCYICKGYLIDATAITECLHTFCKSCIVKRLNTKDGNTCPKCEVVIHRSNPLQGIRLDRTMQDVVYKILPELQKREELREQQFCNLRGVPCEKNQGKNKESGVPENPGRPVDPVLEDRVCIQLDAKTDALKPLAKKYICCSSRTTVNHLRKLVSKKLFQDIDKYNSVDILINDEILGKDHTLKFIYMTRWRKKDEPIELYYQPRVDMLALSSVV